MAIRVTLPEKDEDTDERSPAESLQMAVSAPVQMFLSELNCDFPPVARSTTARVDEKLHVDVLGRFSLAARWNILCNSLG